jgi:putative peptide zinc metalloprotease protein
MQRCSPLKFEHRCRYHARQWRVAQGNYFSMASISNSAPDFLSASGADAPTSVDLQAYEGFNEVCQLDEIGNSLNYIISNKNGQQISLSASAFYLLQAFRAGMSFEELAATLNRKLPSDRAIRPGQLEQLYNDIIGQLAAIEKRTAKDALPFGFWLKWRIVPRPVVNRLSSWLSVFYSPLIALWVLVIIAAAIGSAVYGGMFRIIADRSAFLPSYFLFLLSLAAHEFGHSTACVALGAPASDIGFTVYLIYPAFYSDVTASWRLSRWKRLVVDLGGFYFQLAAGSCFLLVYHFWPWEPLRISFLMMLYTAIISLNPIFKFDGYWALTDLLGVSNLGRQPRRIAAYILDRIRGGKSPSTPWPAGIMAALVVYSLATIWIWSTFLWRMSPLIWSQLLSFLHQCRLLGQSISVLTLPSWPAVQNLLLSLLQLTIVGGIVWSLGQRLAGMAKRKLQARH